jgi:hypothetical protein
MLIFFIVLKNIKPFVVLNYEIQNGWKRGVKSLLYDIILLDIFMLHK